MGDRTTRPHATLRACRIRRYIAPLAGLAGAPVLAQTGTAYVDRVIDGDTISVRLDGDRYTVRFTGVDTPETKHATRGVEPDGPEAADETTARRCGAGWLRTVRYCGFMPQILSNGVELGPTPRVDLAPGETRPVELDARGQTFTHYSVHVEIGSSAA